MKKLSTEEEIKVLFISPRELYLRYYILKYKEVIKNNKGITS